MDWSMEALLQNRAGLNSEALEALAEFAGIGLFNLHIPTGDIQLNRTITQLTGYEPGDLPHTENTKELLTFEEDRELVGKCMNSILSGESDSYELEYRMRRRDGSVVSIRENAIVCERDSTGAPVRLAGLAQDLSRLRWAEEKARSMERENAHIAKQASNSELASQNRMWRAANAAATMIIGGFHQDYETVLRQSLQILAESIEADRAYIWRNTEIDGRVCCFLRAFWSKDASNYAVNRKECIAYEDLIPDWRTLFREQSSIRCRAEDIAKDILVLPGMEKMKSIMIAPLFIHGEFWGLLGFDDCTQGKLFTEDEAEIMATGALVIASSVSRNETFGKLNEAREQAMASTKAKSEFLSRMSHEIRTPMNAIIGMTNIAKKTEDPERIRYCLDKVDASSRQLLNLINDVLDMSKIDSGKFEIIREEFDFEKMVQNVFHVVQVKLEEKHQDLRVDFESVFTHAVISDELRLSQVLINLLNNAMKFTPEGGRILLRIREEALSENRSRLRVEVEDNGIGIDPESQEKLFQSFEQADGSITRNYGGTGLGLAICKKIVTLLDGDIWVESEPGVGSCFVFTAEIDWGEELLAAAAAPSLSSQMRILIVDDAEDVREYFTNILRSFSLECDTAPDGESALKLVQESVEQNKPYHMIFIDWNMPGMNGGKTASEIRRLVGNDVVVVMISVADWADIQHDAQSYGVTNFLSKPVLPSMLYNTIVKLSDNNLVKQRTDSDERCYYWPGRTLLLAEDIEINREIMLTVLEETKVKVVCACDGEQALRAFEEEPERYDLILMDVQMPCMDGLTATRKIRALDHPRAKTIPILAMTANAFKEDAQMCREAGMNEHLSKPLDVDILFRTLSEYIGDSK